MTGKSLSRGWWAALGACGENFRPLCRARWACCAPALALVLFAVDAVAADLPVKAPKSSTDYDWTGFYVGGHIGLAAGNSAWTLEPLGGGSPVAGSFGLYQSPNAFKESGTDYRDAAGAEAARLKREIWTASGW